MRWLLAIIILLLCTNLYAYRIIRPPTLTHPLDEGQVSQLNDYLEQLWFANQGRVDLDIVTTTKSNPNNGELWIFNDSGTYKLEFRAGGATKTITP